MDPESEEAKEVIFVLEKLVNCFLKTKNYHNFTIKGDFKQMNMNRYIKGMKVSILHDQGEEPLVRFELHGQSFIYHQIRNMVGSMVQLF